ncbi:MAG: MFS transporter [Rhodoglobus sp.]|nr:MFS transporter [Rhodoglobus sp.]
MADLRVSDHSSRAVVPVLALGGVLFSITQTMVIPLLPILPAETGVSPSTLSWLVTGPLLVGAALTPALGRLADQLGKRGVLIAVFIALAIGSGVLAVTSNVAVMIAARCLQGLSAAFVPVAISLLRDVIGPVHLARAVGLLSASLGIGGVLGAPIASALAAYADWHVVFLISGALAIVLVVCLVVVVGEVGDRAPGRFDLTGSIMLAIALGAVMLAITEGPTWGWISWPIAGLALGASALFALWGFHQLRVPSPVVDLRLAMAPPIILANTIALLVGFAFFANTLVTAQQLQAPVESGGLGLGLLEAGLLQIPGGVTTIIFSIVSSTITVRFGARTTLLIGTPVMVLGYVVHILGPGLAGAVGGLVVVGSGTAIVYSALPMLLLGSVPRESMASANGINVLIRTIGQTACSAVVAAVLATSAIIVNGHPAPSGWGFDTSFAIAAGASLVAFGVVFLIRGERGRVA